MPEEVPIFYVSDLNQKVGMIAARFYQHPSRRMNVIGITGTNGKTSCSHFIAQTLHTPQHPCAIIGTVGNGVYGQLEESSLTTPDAIQLQSLLADFEKEGVHTVAMEVSSHALDQCREKHVEMQTAIFTNLTRDHLDYHHTMEAYQKAKQKLFERFGLRYAIINRDDPFSETLLKIISKDVHSVTYSAHGNSADVCASNITLSMQGIKATVKTPWGEGELECPILGRFNVSNLLAVLSTLCCNDIEFQDALNRIKKIRGVIGRMQAYSRKGTPLIVIDYAHTPDALLNAVQALREHCQGKIWCIFGCGGNRDQGKRPLMGRIAEQNADHIILCDDNPRHEDSSKIIEEIAAGFTSRKNNPLVEHDRRKALALALKQATANDCILLAGKGHERYQQIGDQRILQSDQGIVEELIESLNNPL